MVKHISQVLLLSATLFLASGVCIPAAEPIDVGSDKQFIPDGLFVAESQSVSLKVQPPQKTGNVILKPEHEWESASLNWFNFAHDVLRSDRALAPEAVHLFRCSVGSAQTARLWLGVESLSAMVCKESFKTSASGKAMSIVTGAAPEFIADVRVSSLSLAVTTNTTAPSGPAVGCRPTRQVKRSKT